MNRLSAVRKWGNSYAVRLPRSFMHMLHLDENSRLETFVDSQHIIYRSTTSPQASLTARLQMRSNDELDAPAAGDILATDPAYGSVRWLVVSEISFNRATGRAFVCPVMMSQSKIRGLMVSTDWGWVHCDQIQSLDWRGENLERLAGLSPFKLRSAQALVRAVCAGGVDGSTGEYEAV